MKKPLFISVILVISFNSCIREYVTDTRFHVKNQSNRELSLTLFNTDFGSFGFYKDTTLLLPNGTQITYGTNLKGEDSPDYFPFGPSTDSVYITFDDNVRIIYRQPLRFSNGGNRNILSRESYTGGKSGEKNSISYYEYFYSITEQDYLDAIGK